MEWQIQVTLLVIGLGLMGYFFVNYNKKKKVDKENQKLKHQFAKMAKQIDDSGFDFNGVSAPRQAKSGTGLSDNQEEAEVAKPSESLQPKVEAIVASQQEETLFESVEEPIVEKNLEVEEPTDGNMPEQVFSLILQASSYRPFKGEEFLPVFESQGLRYGEMGIFHRHKYDTGNPGPVMFSLANAISPGTFSAEALSDFETPAFALFMTLPGPYDGQVAYDLMIKTAQVLQIELGGQILDERKSVYSEVTHRKRIEIIQSYVR